MISFAIIRGKWFQQNDPPTVRVYFDGLTIFSDDPSGAACIPGGVSP
jgi:hypothetical protein